MGQLDMTDRPDTRTTENPEPHQHWILDDTVCVEDHAEAAQGAAPRAEGLDVVARIRNSGRRKFLSAQANAILDAMLDDEAGRPELPRPGDRLDFLNAARLTDEGAAPRAEGLDGDELVKALDEALHDTPHWSYRFDRLQLAQILGRKVAARLAPQERQPKECVNCGFSEGHSEVCVHHPKVQEAT